MTINFQPEDLDISLYSGDQTLINFRVYSVDDSNYINTGSWGFLFYNKQNGKTVCSTPTLGDDNNILPGAAPQSNLSASPQYNVYRSKEYFYTATNAQTTFTGADNNGTTLAYVAGKIDVFKNNVEVDEADYTATNGTSVVLDTGAALNDEIKIVAVNYLAPTGVTEIFISGSVTNILSSSANNIGYEFYLNTSKGKITFIKGDSAVESRITN